MITNGPIVPAQPDQGFYAVDTLQLFKRLTRATAITTFGEEPPSWDKTKRIKRWFDTSHLEAGVDPKTVVEYTYFDYASRTFKTMTMTAQEAASVNLPGVKSYPKYAVEPTPAEVVGPNGPVGPLNPELLSTLVQAEGLSVTIQGEGVKESDGFKDGGYTIAWNGEKRRMHMILREGHWYNVGLLLASRNKGGIGSPGVWVLQEKVPPSWAPQGEENGEQDIRPEIPIPVRPLLENEILLVNRFGAHVVRKDIASELNPGIPAMLVAAQPVVSGLPPDQFSVVQETLSVAGTILDLLEKVKR